MSSIAAARRAFCACIDDKTLAFADFRGNRQYISLGNLAADDRAALILMDYPRRARLKIYAHVETRELGDDPALDEAPGDAGLSRQGRTRVRASPRGVRLELPAAHHAALHRGRVGRRRSRGCAAGSRSWRPRTRFCASVLGAKAAAT